MDFSHANGCRNEVATQPLNVVIVGAGIGGLCAAIFLRKQGHKVTLLEQSRFANELGAAVHLAPNANGLLRRIGLKPEDKGAVKAMKMSQWFPDGKVMFSIDLTKDAARWQHPWQLAHRISLHSELKRLATCVEGGGKPAELRTRSKVVDVDAKKGEVTLESGETLQGDVIVGADGAHSRMRNKIPGAENIKTFGSGKSAFRFLIPRDKVLADPNTRKFAEHEGHLVLVMGRDRRVVVYPTNDNTLLNFVCIHPTSESQILSEAPGSSDWQNQGSLSKMLEIYRDFEPAVVKLLSMADEETLKVWELLDMESLPSWTHKKLVLIGDAAHPFTPHQGQGAGQAIEDAASLAVMLPFNISIATVPARLKLYEKCRYERASRIQEYSRIAGMDLGSGPPLDAGKFTAYNFGHDEWDYSSQMLRKWEWGNNPNMYWRMPIAFGPMPGPRQDFSGRPRDGSKSTFTVASIKIKTSRTVLENLFSSPRMKFAAPNTVAYATFEFTQLGNLEWLGGRGYCHFGLYMHDVAYTKKDGDAVHGTHLPILFENLADPIVSGREELGFPKVFCDLEMQRDSTGVKISASWMNSKFLRMSLSELDEPQMNGEQMPQFDEGQKEEDLLLHKYVPSTRNSPLGKADAEYTVIHPRAAEGAAFEKNISKVLAAKKSELSFDALDWKALPTLHHIIARLEEIPVYGIVDAKIVEGSGVGDVCLAKVLE